MELLERPLDSPSIQGDSMKPVIALTAAGLAAASFLVFAAPGEHQGRMAERLKAADTNGDGRISKAEAAALPMIAKPFDEIGATDVEVRDYAKLERAAAVDRVLAGARREAGLKPPAFVDAAFVRFVPLNTLSDEDRQREVRRRLDEAFAIREWWLREMLGTPSPITERMTLFWHGHFATSLQKVYSAKLMYGQNALLRSESLGNFATLLHGIARDPAMLIYLDNARSRREAPNENFAREAMELFTLGEGRYTERDVKEAARAFTGWSLERDTATFVRRAAWHDGSPKTVLGQTGRFDGKDILDILLARPETAEFIATKLWKELVSPTPDAKEVKRLAGVFRDARYEVKPLVRALLLSDSFWSKGNRRALVKSPVDP